MIVRTQAECLSDSISINFKTTQLSYSDPMIAAAKMKFPILTLFCCTLCFGSLARAELPELGDPTLQNFSTRDETELGQAFYHALRASLSFVDDLQVEHYIKSLGQRLVSHSDAAGKNFHFFMINSPQINAFAGPDAYIGINSGLLQATQNESQLAGVMAHEIAHVAQRHIARSIDRSGNSTAVSLATLIAAILVGSQDPQAGQAILLTGLAGSQQAAINFTRSGEYEADRVGIGILTKTGIDPAGMVEFFEILQSQSRAGDLEYLRTHPLNENRVSEARSRIRENQVKLPNDSDDFHFAKARTEVLTSHQPEQLIEKNAHATDVFGRYQKAVALIKAQRPEPAVTILQALAKRHNHPWIKLALAEAYEDENQSSKALAVLDQLATLYPGYLPVTLRYAETLTANGQSQKSISLLKRQLEFDDDAVIHQQLAKAYFLNGQTAAALESTGNQYLREGYFELASQQYENALHQTGLSESSQQRLREKQEKLKEKIKQN